MKYLLLTSLLAFSLVSAPVMAQQTTMTKAEIKAQLKEEKARQRAERKKNKDKSSEVVVVTPTPAPAPTVVTPSPAPAPTTTITPYMQAQIDAALARPQSFNCTYCAAFAASQGDLATVAAIGAGTYMEGAATAQVDTTSSEAPPAPEAAPAQADTDSSAPADTQTDSVTTDTNADTTVSE